MVLVIPQILGLETISNFHGRLSVVSGKSTIRLDGSSFFEPPILPYAVEFITTLNRFIVTCNSRITFRLRSGEGA